LTPTPAPLPARRPPAERAVSRPDKHGNRNVVLRQAGIDNSLPVDEPAYEQLQPLLQALKSAGVSVAG